MRVNSMLDLSFLNKRSARLLILALSGFLTGLCICYPQIGIIQWISLVPAVLVIYKLTESGEYRLRGIYAYGLFFFESYFLAAWYWFAAMYPLEFAGLDPVTAVAVIIIAILGLPLLQASTFAFALVLFVKIKRGRVLSKFPLASPFLFALLWAVFEWTQTLFWFGVPWGRLVLGQSSLLFTMQSASLFGSYFVTFLIVAVNALIAYALCYVSARRAAAVCCASVFAVNAIAGVILTSVRPHERETVRVAALQGNLPSTEKLDSNTRDTYAKLTREAAEAGAQIVVWPESTVRTSIVEDTYARKWMSNLAEDNEIILIVGTFSNKGIRYYNSAVTFMPDGSMSDDVYSKRYLVPFGEYVPMRDVFAVLLPWLTEINMLSYDLTAGEDAGILHTEYGNIGSMICFDSIYEQASLDSVREGAELLIIETNDSWFGNSVALRIHESHAQLRAIEVGRYIACSANTGVSVTVSPKGEILKELPIMESGYLLSEVGFIEENTLYSYIGNLFIWLAIGAIAGLLSADVTFKLLDRRKDL